VRIVCVPSSANVPRELWKRLSAAAIIGQTHANVKGSDGKYVHGQRREYFIAIATIEWKLSTSKYESDDVLMETNILFLRNRATHTD
jgi:hypothetical protein